MFCILKFPVIAVVLAILAVSGCASEQNGLEDLPLFRNMKKANNNYLEARKKVSGIDDIPVEEALEKIDEALELNKKAIDLQPESRNFQFFHALLLHRRGLYHDNQAIYYDGKARGKKYDKRLEKWIDEEEHPSSEDRELWRKKSKQQREIANGFFNRALRKLDIVERLEGDEPRVMDERAKIYILMMNMSRARDIYVKLSRDTRLTDDQRNIAQDMILKIDRNEFYQKQKEREESSLFQNDSKK
ncbi:MAG: hypothetical protein ACYS8W_12245 [Planctomycetota bacterium]|jgi:tetratricopeptide (TPR) repeat protein